MATEIVNISGSNFLNMEKTTISRQLPIGTDWTKLAIGMRFSWENIGTDVVPTTPDPEGFLGVCAGQKWPVGRTSPIHALGTTIEPYGGIVGTPQRIQMRDCYWVRKIGSTTTYAASLERWWVQSIAYLPSDNGVTTATWVLHITKGSPWVINLISKANAVNEDIPPEISLNTFRQAMLTSNATTVATLIGGSSRERNVTIDESTNGYFDTLCLYFPIERPSLFISEMSVVKFTS